MLLEGLEVVVIVLTFGISAGNIPLAAVGALLAILPVTALVVIIRGPLAKVPENAIKMTVGLLLTTYGTFWAIKRASDGSRPTRRASHSWPLGDVALLLILATWIGVARALVLLLRRRVAIYNHQAHDVPESVRPLLRYRVVRRRRLADRRGRDGHPRAWRDGSWLSAFPALPFPCAVFLGLVAVFAVPLVTD